MPFLLNSTQYFFNMKWNIDTRRFIFVHIMIWKSMSQYSFSQFLYFWCFSLKYNLFFERVSLPSINKFYTCQLSAKNHPIKRSSTYGINIPLLQKQLLFVVCKDIRQTEYAKIVQTNFFMQEGVCNGVHCISILEALYNDILIL